MKLIIDIPEDSYERVMNPDKFYRDIDGEKIRWAVYKGIPIPDNATNGDVLDKIRAEIMQSDIYYDNDYFSGNRDPMYKCNDVLQIIDKYK